MAKDITDFRLRLLEKIRHVDSENAVQRLIEAAVRTLYEKKVNGHIIARFLDKLMIEIENSSTTDPASAINLAVAMKKLGEIKNTMTKKVG